MKFFWLLLCCLLSVVPCGAEQVEFTGGLRKVVLQLKWHHQFQFAGYYAAIEQGYYREAGLEVELRERTPGQKRTVELLLAGQANYAIEGTNVLISRIQGEPLVALAAIFQHSPVVAIGLQENNLNAASDLVGKRLMSYGVESEIPAMLLQEGIDPTQIKILPASHPMDSLISGKTDFYSGYLTNETFFLEQQQVPYSIINPINYGIDFYGDILFTSETELMEHPQRAAAFRQASLKGWQYALAHPEEIVDLILARYSQKKSREHLLYEARESLKLITPEVVEIGHINPGRLAHMAVTLKQLGQVNTTAGLDGFIYNEKLFSQLSQAELKWLQQKHPVQVFVTHAPPLIYVQGDRVEGLVIDYLNRLTTEFGITLEYVPSIWNDSVRGLENKTGPDVIPVITPSSVRKTTMALSEPFLSMPNVIFSQDNDRFIGGIEDLSGLKVSLPKGFLIQSILEKEFPDVQLVRTATMQEALSLLGQGEVDAYIGSLMLTSHSIKELGLENIKVAAPFPIMSPDRVLAARTDWPELISLFNRIVLQMTPQEHSEIRQRWMAMRYEYGVSQKEIRQWSMAIVLLVASGLLLFILWRRSLKKEIQLRKSTENALLDSVQMYQSLVQSIPHGVVEIDHKLQIVFCNQSFAHLIDSSQQQLFGRKMTDLITDDTQATALREQYATSSQIGEWPPLMVHLKGKQQNHLVQIDIDPSEKERSENRILIVTDLSHRERVEQALQLSEELYRNTLEHAQVGIVHARGDGPLLRVNSYLALLLGYQESELLGLQFSDFTHPDDLQASRELAESLVQTGDHGSLVKRYLKKDGTPIWVLVTLTVLKREAQEYHLVAVIQDIDQLKRQQEQVKERSESLDQVIQQRTLELQTRISEVEGLNQAMTNLAEDLQSSNLQLQQKGTEVEEINKELESFAYSVSHDLRAPLRHIQGFANILRDKAREELSADNAQLLTTIMQATEKMAQLIDDLLLFSRVSRSELIFKSIDTKLLVKNIISDLQDSNPGRVIDWQVGDLPVVNGDLSTLRQVFVNLLDNAVKYSAPQDRGNISVHCQQTGEEQVFCVTDNGVGFNPKYHHKLFGVFSRLHSSDQFEGSGIGLANVKRIVKRHQGKVWAESEIDCGARFYFSLPLKRNALDDEKQPTNCWSL